MNTHKILLDKLAFKFTKKLYKQTLLTQKPFCNSSSSDPFLPFQYAITLHWLDKRKIALIHQHYLRNHQLKLATPLIGLKTVLSIDQTSSCAGWIAASDTYALDYDICVEIHSPIWPIPPSQHTSLLYSIARTLRHELEHLSQKPHALLNSSVAQLINIGASSNPPEKVSLDYWSNYLLNDLESQAHVAASVFLSEYYGINLQNELVTRLTLVQLHLESLDIATKSQIHHLINRVLEQWINLAANALNTSP